MNTIKIFLLASVAAICYFALASIEAHADEDVLVHLTDRNCIELRIAVEETFELYEMLEEDGGVINGDAIGSLLQAALVYVDHCQERTGVLFEGGE